MAKSQLALDNEIRAKVIEDFFNAFGEREDLQIVGSNQVAYPTVDSEGNEKWVILIAKVPKGDYDGYNEAKSYQLELEEKKEKALERKKKAEEKAKRDAERRAKKKEKAE